MKYLRMMIGPLAFLAGIFFADFLGYYRLNSGGWVSRNVATLALDQATANNLLIGFAIAVAFYAVRATVAALADARAGRVRESHANRRSPAGVIE